METRVVQMTKMNEFQHLFMFTALLRIFEQEPNHVLRELRESAVLDYIRVLTSI